MIRVILYDLDGVLVEAREWHYTALNRALKEVAGTEITREEHVSSFNGLPTRKKLVMLSELGRVKTEDFESIWTLKQNLTKDTIRATATVDKVKNVLHRYTRGLGVKSACVTNSITETACLMLDCTGQLPYMDMIISNELVVNPKPHPEAYIRAMLHFGLSLDEYLIVEDSPIGIKCAEATGAKVLRVSCCDDVTIERISDALRV
jgi:beta-phosphoglucomutase-like phosphatase (HAD superfamily)